MYDNFANLLKQKGLKPKDVSVGTGIREGVFSDWKNGRYTPKIDKLQKIAEFLGISVEYLMTGQDTEKESASGKKYYFSDETAEMAQQLFENKELRMLFDASRDSRPEDLQMAADLLARLKGTNPNG